jgi:hypothetical protein
MQRFIGAVQPITHLDYIIFELTETYSTTCNICNSMPPKRPLTDANSYQSPPPAHRDTQGNEHHHSPIPGHHPETPADAAVSVTTPPRNFVRNADENDETNPMAATRAMQRTPQAEMQPVAVVSGGARAAYQASQQQRIITCNLANIPPSK